MVTIKDGGVKAMVEGNAVVVMGRRDFCISDVARVKDEQNDV